jgi:putative transcriptional regulator
VHNDLVGRCLVARPHLEDPFFQRSVVYIYESTASGIAGVILNKRNYLKFENICAQRGFAFIGTQNPHVYCGGPVNESAILMLHSNDFGSTNTMSVTPHISISSDNLMIEKIAMDNTPSCWRIFNGCSIWHPKQLLGEIRSNSWLITDLTLTEIFDLDARTQWDTGVNRTANQMLDKLFT